MAEGACSNVRRACHCGFYADGSLFNNSEKGGFRFLFISTLSKGSMSLDKGNGPRRQGGNYKATTPRAAFRK
jgi:hypothetical protein